MADNEKKPTGAADGISSIADEEAITEIDIGSFLDDKESKTVMYEGFHEDIKHTEQSLEDEIQNLMDSIMSTGPVTIVPKPIDELTSEKKEETPMENLWMSPEDYIEIPDVKPEPSETELDPTPVSDVEKDDLFNMIDSLKADTDNETGYDELISDIESNENFDPVDPEKDDVTSLAEGFVPSPEPPEPGPVEPKSEDEGIDIHSEDFDHQLAELLGDEEKKEKEPEITVAAPPRAEPFKVTIEDEPAEFVPVTPPVTPPPVVTILPQTGQRTVGNIPVDIIEDDGKISRKERKQARVDAKVAEGKNPKVGEIIRRIVLAASILVIIGSLAVLANTYIIEPYRFKKSQSELSDIIAEPHEEDPGENVTAVSDKQGNTVTYPEGMLAKYRKLYKINSDLSGWISIPSLEIDLPIVKGTDNDYYLHRNIYKKRTNYGVPFYDYRIADLHYLPRNTVVYGHNMHYDDLIFGLLENYREISGFKQAPVIECNTIFSDHNWLVYAAFITNSKESQDNGYMLQYNFLDISQSKFVEYIAEIDKRKFYTTGVDIQPTDKILTLSTCCYDFDDARLVVIARLQRDGESLSVDTSKAVKNENPKYPQAWYNANKKTNPYVDDTKWYPNS